MLDNTDDLTKVFSDCYKDAVDGKLSPTEIPELVRDKKVQSFIDYIIRASSNYDDIPDVYLVTLQSLISILQFAYTNGVVDTGVSDTDFDKLYETMTRYGMDEVISVPLSSNVVDVEQHAYTDLRGTLSKVYFLTDEEKKESEIPNRRSLPEWVKHTESLYKSLTGKSINIWDEDVVVMPKFDGVSVVLEYDEDGKLLHALLRGDTINNQTRNVIHLFKRYKKHKFLDLVPVAHGVKCELMTTKQCLKEWNETHIKEYKRPLSLVAAIVNMDPEEVTDEMLDMLILVPLREQRKNEIPVMSNELMSSDNFSVKVIKLSEITKLKKFINKHYRDINGLYCDGAVIRFTNEDLIEILGRSNDMPNYEVAYKYTEEVAYSKVVDVNFQLTAYGNIAPVLEIEPVVIKGKTITNVSLGSMPRFKSLNLKEGDEVCVICDVVPYVIKNDKCKDNEKGRFINPPSKCPECREPMTSVGSNYKCNNPDCPGKVMGSILTYVNRMKIKGISTKKIEALYRAGYLKSITDLYKLDKHRDEIVSMKLFGDISFDMMMKSINGRRVVPGSAFLAGIGIEHVGESTFSKVLQKFALDELIDRCDDCDLLKKDLLEIKGLGENTVENIIQGLIDNKKTIKKLLKEVTPVVENTNDYYICFTKIPDPVIESYRNKIESKGWNLTKNINKKVKILVTPSVDIRATRKIDFAKENNIKIMSLKDFDALMNM